MEENSRRVSEGREAVRDREPKPPPMDDGASAMEAPMITQ